MGIFARHQRCGDLGGFGLCGYCGASKAIASELRQQNAGGGVVTLNRETPGHVLASKVLARHVVKYWIIGLSFCMIS